MMFCSGGSTDEGMMDIWSSSGGRGIGLASIVDGGIGEVCKVWFSGTFDNDSDSGSGTMDEDE